MENHKLMPSKGILVNLVMFSNNLQVTVIIRFWYPNMEIKKVGLRSPAIDCS